MKTKWVLLIVAILLMISFGSSMFVSSRMPEKMASHWNEYGRADGYSNKTVALYVIPGTEVAVLLLLVFLPRVDPLKGNIEKFKSTYDLFLVGFTGFMTYLHILTLTWNLGARINMTVWMMPGLAALMFLTGHLVSKARQNYFIGIRTPWTLANSVVWDDTHRLGGIGFKLVAGLSILGILFPDQAFFFLMAPLLVLVVGLVLYSYLRYVEVTQKHS